MIQEVVTAFISSACKKHVKVGRLSRPASAQLAAAPARRETEPRRRAKAAAEAKGKMPPPAGQRRRRGQRQRRRRRRRRGQRRGRGQGCRRGQRRGRAKAEGTEDSAAAAAEKKPAGSSGLEDLMLGWSEARIKAWNGRHKNENAYYYRFNAPEAQANAKWSEAEHDLSMATLAKCNGKHGDEPGKADYV